MSNSVDSFTYGNERSDEETAGPKSNKGFLIVGLGGSAGAITAFKEFFQNVPRRAAWLTSSSCTSRPITTATSPSAWLSFKD